MHSTHGNHRRLRKCRTTLKQAKQRSFQELLAVLSAYALGRPFVCFIQLVRIRTPWKSLAVTHETSQLPLALLEGIFGELYRCEATSEKPQ